MKNTSNLFTRITTEIQNYLTQEVEISPGVMFSQHKTIERIYKFRNRTLSNTKMNDDLSYNFYFDIISPRCDSEVKNLRFDTKHIMLFSRNPRADFAAVFLANSSLKSWMAENGEDEKLKDAVEEFSANGNVGFKRIKGGYEIIDPLNTYITNTAAKTVDDTDIIERHELTASQIKRMEVWNQEVADEVIEELGNKTLQKTELTTATESSSKKYEIYEFTGEVSECEYYEALEACCSDDDMDDEDDKKENKTKYMEGDKEDKKEGDKNKYFLAKIVVAGLRNGGSGKKYVLFCEKLDGKISDHYIYAHRGRYDGRFWRIGVYETLIDHQIRANEIGNQLARGLDWSSRVIFVTSDTSIMQNLRADMDNGDIITADGMNLRQLEVRMQGMDQLIADWNRLNSDADKLTNSYEVVRGESMPSGTPFRSAVLADENAGKLFALYRQKITLPYKRVFREWVLPDLMRDMSGQEVFDFTGDTDMLDQLRAILAESWYMDNLIKIGPHTREMAEAFKQAKIEELQKQDPIVRNIKDIWKGIHKRVFVTITGENSDIQDQIQDMITFIGMEQDPARIEWLLDTMYRVRNIPIPPKQKPEPQQQTVPGMDQASGQAVGQDQMQQSPVQATQPPVMQ